MASTVELYVGPIKIGSGSATADSASITGFSDTSGLGESWKVSPTSPYGNGNAYQFHPAVTVLVTQAGTHVGRSWYTKITGDNGSGTLTLRDACPFVGA